MFDLLAGELSVARGLRLQERKKFENENSTSDTFRYSLFSRPHFGVYSAPTLCTRRLTTRFEGLTTPFHSALRLEKAELAVGRADIRGRSLEGRASSRCLSRKTSQKANKLPPMEPLEPTPVRRASSGGLSAAPPAGVEEESPRRRLFSSAAKDIAANRSTSSNHHFSASTPPALASLLTPSLAGGSPQALCCAGVSPRALFGGGRSMNAETPSIASSKRELLLTTTTPAVEPDDDDEGDVIAASRNKMGGLAAATHAVSSYFSFFNSYACGLLFSSSSSRE